MGKYWQLGAFYSRCKNVQFKAGEDELGKKMRLRLKYYI